MRSDWDCTQKIPPEILGIKSTFIKTQSNAIGRLKIAKERIPNIEDKTTAMN